MSITKLSAELTGRHRVVDYAIAYMCFFCLYNYYFLFLYIFSSVLGLGRAPCSTAGRTEKQYCLSPCLVSAHVYGCGV